MRYTLITILALSLAAPAMAQTPRETAPPSVPTSEFTNPLPGNVPDLNGFESLDFTRILTLAKTDITGGTLHRQLLVTGICVQGEECEFLIHATLFLKKQPAPAVMAMRYVLLNKNGRAEGLALSGPGAGANRYWRLAGTSWAEYEKDSDPYRLEEGFVAGTWDFVVQNQN